MRLWAITAEGRPWADTGLGVGLEDGLGDGPVADLVAQVVEATRALYARRGHEAPWLGYLAREAGAWVGTCGFVGPPAQGEVELAYFSFPGQEGRGLAMAMAKALLVIADDASHRGAIVAHTLPQAGASASILTRLGFECLGEWPHPEDGLVWKWRLMRP